MNFLAHILVTENVSIYPWSLHRCGDESARRDGDRVENGLLGNETLERGHSEKRENRSVLRKTYLDLPEIKCVSNITVSHFYHLSSYFGMFTFF